MLNYTLFTPFDMYNIKNNELYKENLSKPHLVKMYKKEFSDINPSALDDSLRFWQESNDILKETKININKYKNILSWYASRYNVIENFIIDNIQYAEKAIQSENNNNNNL